MDLLSEIPLEFSFRLVFKVSLECDDNPKIRSVLMTGSGEDAFCAGGDVNSFYNYGNSLQWSLQSSVM